MSLPQRESRCNTLRTYPTLAASAMRAGYSEAMRLYELVQMLVSARNGIPFFSRAECINLGLLSPQQVDRALANGLGVFWARTSQDDYHMTSRAKVGKAVGHVGNPGRVVLMDPKAYTGRLTNWKSAIYAAYLGQLKRLTPSRESLCRRFGVSLPTLLKWERRERIIVKPRFVHVDLEDVQTYEACDEVDEYSTERKWITIQGPRGGVIAGRRLMDNANQPLGDYWDVVRAPAWEPDCTPVMTWQDTNVYLSPAKMAATGRARWLRAEILCSDTPAVIASGGAPEPERSAAEYALPVKWCDSAWEALRFQKRKHNVHRVAVAARHTKRAIYGTFWPSRGARGLS